MKRTHLYNFLSVFSVSVVIVLLLIFGFWAIKEIFVPKPTLIPTSTDVVLTATISPTPKATNTLVVVPTHTATSTLIIQPTSTFTPVPTFTQIVSPVVIVTKIPMGVYAGKILPESELLFGRIFSWRIE